MRRVNMKKIMMLLAIGAMLLVISNVWGKQDKVEGFDTITVTQVTMVKLIQESNPWMSEDKAKELEEQVYLLNPHIERRHLVDGDKIIIPIIKQ
jgi:hypothetical protein